jgi:hypothetical protein
MGIHQSRIPPYWNYFLALEEDLVTLSRWIEFTKANASCYSLELARLLMVSAQEVDVVARDLCAGIAPKTKAGNINAYRSVLLSKYKGLQKSKVEIPKHGMTLTPWATWSGHEPPIWWTANNKVKHERSRHFDKATLQNALNAVGGLFILLLLNYAQSRPSITPAPKLLQPRSYAFRDGDHVVFNEKARGS